MHERHSFLTSLLGVTKPEEDESHATITKLVTWVPVITLLLGAAEAAMYIIYNFKAHPWRFIVCPPKMKNPGEAFQLMAI